MIGFQCVSAEHPILPLLRKIPTCLGPFLQTVFVKSKLESKVLCPFSKIQLSPNHIQIFLLGAIP